MTYDPGKDPAFPLPIGQPGPIGLTKREYFAVLILSGMRANSDIDQDTHFEELSRHAIGQADVLLQALTIPKAPPIDPEMEELRSEFEPTLLVETGHE